MTEEELDLKKKLETEMADLTWFWGMDWFAQTPFGNFHIRDSSYGIDPGAPTVVTKFEGDYNDFCKFLNIDFGRDKGFRFIYREFGEDFIVKINK